jgi:hypothetical protein
VIALAVCLGKEKWKSGKKVSSCLELKVLEFVIDASKGSYFPLFSLLLALILQ